MSALRHSRWLLSLLIGFPLIALITLAVAASPQPKSARQPKLLEIAQVQGEPAGQPADEPGQEQPEPEILFNFQGAPWSQVLDRFSQLAGLSLVMEVAPAGSFSYTDERPYTVTEALDLVNRVLLAKGFLLVRKQDLLILVATDKPIPTGLLSVVEIDELAKRGDNELVTLSIPLEHISPESLTTEIEPLLSTFGKTAALTRTKRLLVTDLVANLHKIHPLVTEIDNAARPKPAPPSPPAPPKVEKILSVEHADAAVLAETLRKFFSGRAEVEEFGDKTLLVQATADMQQKVADLVGQIDQPPAEKEPAVESIFPLKHLTAEDFALSLQTLFPATARNARFTADRANNAIVALAPKAVNETVASLISELDRPAAGTPVPKSYAPKHVELDSLLATLQTLYGSEQTRFTTDPRRRRIIVTAPPEVQAKIAAMIDEIDQPTGDSGARREQVYRLKHARAATVAAMLETLYPTDTTDARFSSAGADDILIVVASDALQANVRRLIDEIDRPRTETTTDRTYTPRHVRTETLRSTLESLYGNQSSTRFTTDPRSETLIISAPPEVHEKIEAMLAQLDQPQDPERTPVSRFYKLEHATGGALVSPLQTLFPEATHRARFSFDATNNALIVAAPESAQQAIAEAIRQMDEPPASARRVDRVYELRRADPQAVMSSLEKLYGNEADFVVDPANRAVIASSSERLQEKIAAIIEQLDKAPADEGPPLNYRVYALRFANPDALATALRTVFERRANVRILSDPTNRSLVVVAPAELQEVIGAMVQDADQDNQSSRLQEKVYRLSHVASPTLIETLTTLYGSGEGVRITPGPRNQAVVVVGTAAVHRKVEAMLAQLDETEDSTREPLTRGYPLEHARAESVAAALGAQFESRSGVTITPDPNNNSLIVKAPARLQLEIAGVIRQVDEPPVGSRRTDRVYQLEHAASARVLSSLQNLYGGEARFVEDPAKRLIIANASETTHEKIATLIQRYDTPEGEEGATRHQAYRLRFADPAALASTLATLYQNRGDVRVVADPPNRSLMVVAPPAVHKRIAELIGDLETSGDAEAKSTQRTYRLQFASADSLVSALQSLYQDRRDVRIVPDSPNRSLLVVAPDDVQKAIAELVKESDQDARASGLVEKVFRPKNVTAASIVPTLSTLYAPPNGNARFSLHAGGEAVVIVAPESMHQRIAATLQLLDEPEDPQTRPVAKVYRLENTSRDHVVTALQSVYTGNPRVRITGGTDPAAVTVVAPQPEQKRIAALVGDMDRPAEAGEERLVQVIDLVEVDPFTARSTISNMYRNLPQQQMPFVEADYDPEQLVVRGTAEQIEEIKKLLVQMGEDPSLAAAAGGRGRTVRTIRVREGSPRSLAVAIQRLWPRLRRNPLRVIVPDSVESRAPAPPEQQTEAADRPAKSDRETLPGDPAKPVVLTVTGTNLIAASDDADALSLVERLARSLTEVPDPDQGDFTVFYLDTADAETVAETLDTAFNGPLDERGRRRRGEERVRVVANPEANAVIVRGAPADLVSVEEMIDSLDSPDLTHLDATNVHIVPLKQATASEVAEVLREVYRDYLTSDSEGPAGTRGFRARRSRRSGGALVPVSIGVDERSNSLVISAPEDLFAQIETLIEGLETAAGDATRRYRVMPLDRANSLDVREALDILLQRDRGTAPRSRSGGDRRRRERRPNRSRRPTSSVETRESKPLARANLSPDSRGTEIATFRMGAGRVAEDNDRRVTTSRSSKQVPSASVALTSFEGTSLAQADPDTAAPLPEATTPEGRLSDLAEVDALPDLNVILLWGTDQDLGILGEVVEQIERLAADRRLTFRLVPLAHVKASRMAELIDELYTGIVNARGTVTRTEEEARAIPLAKPNAILLAAPKNDLAQIVDLIDELDQPVPPSSLFRVFRLAHASVTDLTGVITEFFSGRSDDGELALEMVVTPDLRSNSLVVMAAPRDMAEVARLVNDLDVETTAAVNQMRVFRLENTEATQLSTVLQQAIQGSGGGGPVAESVMLRFLRPDEQSGRFIESGILENVRITANPGANTLVVSAPPRTMGLIAELIEELDVLPSTAVEIKVFTLEHSDAQRMADTLQSLFTQVEGFGGQIAPSIDTVDALQPTSSPLVQLSFSVDTRTNSLLVSGSPAQLEVVEAIILRLDGSDAQERRTAVYRLKNATAEEVAAALSTFLERQLLQQVQQVGAVSPAEIIERNVVVVPEAITNSLLISAVPRFFPELQRLIEQLDEAPPQVVIQVLIAQVNLTDDEEFGLELGIQDSLLFRRGIFPGTSTLAPPFVDPGVLISSNQTPGVPGFNFNNQPLGNNPHVSPGNLGGQGLSHFGVGRVGSDGFGGLVLAASSESISILLRALKAQGRVDVLSRPQVTTLDNQEAFIQVGQKVPIVTNSVITGNGSVINPVNFQDVGIILLVTPKINPDGTIVMRVGPEISRLAQSSVEVSTGVFAPIIDVTRAETTISAMDGQTVVIGGLITDLKNSQHRSVPILGDIPILEWAFRFDQDNCEKRELLILMTPHVVRSPLDAERIKQMETERMDWVEETVEEVHGPIFGVPGEPPAEPLEGEPALPDEMPPLEGRETDPYFLDSEPARDDSTSQRNPEEAPKLLPAQATEGSSKPAATSKRRKKKEARRWNLFRRTGDE